MCEEFVDFEQRADWCILSESNKTRFTVHVSLFWKCGLSIERAIKKNVLVVGGYLNIEKEKKLILINLESFFLL